MIKAKFLASLAAATVLTMSAAAHAAPTITYSAPLADGSFAATFGSFPVGSFNDVFLPFTITTSGNLTGTIGTSDAGKNDVDFSSATVTGPAGVIPFFLFALPLGTNPDGLEGGFIPGAFLTPGTYTLAVSGFSSSKASSYAGSLSFAAVPEPTSWALMILGVGAIGFGMRRQRSTTGGIARYRVSYS